MPSEIVPTSTFLDFTGYRITDATTVAAAYGFDASKSVPVTASPYFNVALVLERANDPTALLHSDWATRQQTLQDLNKSGTLWSTYGADKALYDSVVTQLKGPGYNLKVLDATNSNYVSSAESRTIWVQINNSTDFEALFQTPLLQQSPKGGQVYWNGSLSLPQDWKVSGIWVDTSTSPNASVLGGTPVSLVAGAQSPGNSALPKIQQVFPQDIAALYNFPLRGEAVKTGTIGLIEPGVATSLKDDPTGSNFQVLLNTYIATTQQTGTGVVLPPQGISGQSGASGERSLDVGIVAAINPNSDLALYNGSGATAATGFATAGVFTAAQSAIWDTVNNPAVTSNSWGDAQSMSPGSPFYRAYWELFADAALRNQTTFIALGDGGSGNQTANGVTNLEYNITQPYNIVVGGSTISTKTLAQADATLNYLLAPALAGDKGTIWQLVAGGLNHMPSSLSAMERFVETVWNTYYLDGKIIQGPGNTDFYTGYLVNSTGSGGVDPTQPVPWYQAAYGLHPVTSDPLAQVGRGAPDVAAIGGGNLLYTVPPADMVGTTYSDGTSAASPLWASLAVQLNVIFNDQKLPNLGFMNDLLYIAAAVAPASFNDITVGNNTSSFVYADKAGPDTYRTTDDNGNMWDVQATGFGYSAGYGYDLVTGLGSPNGLLLARSLTAIAHAQMSYSSVPALLDQHVSGWTSGTDQALLFQTMSAVGTNVGIDIGTSHVGYVSAASGAYAWTSRFAQQALQSDFDPALVTMYDKQQQGTVAQSAAGAGQLVAVDINAQAASAVQGTLTTDFGFADFMSSAGVVRVARAVAVAETVGALNDQAAIVRLRQDGQDTMKIGFYRVDDFAGTIGGIAPGSAGYDAAAQARLYQFESGGTSVTGPGYGAYAEARIQHVNAGDLVAMTLTNQTAGSTFWAFAQANETVAGQGVGHLWNYGLNTWGWEDTPGGGDHDYNDLVVQLDFTSAYGHHLIA